MSSAFTCITCRVAFHDGQAQRTHYKSDWHRYNLKRKVADFLPVSVEEFNRRVTTQRQQDKELAQEFTIYCNVCRKGFGKQNAFDNHLNSKKHKLALKEANSEGEFTEGVNIQTTRVKTPSVSKLAVPATLKEDEAMDTDSEAEEVDSDEWDDWEDEDNPLFNNNCLFCSHHSANMLKNLKHMSVAHSFFIPDADFIVDPHGLLMYLGEKVYQGFVCLWCDDRSRMFNSVEAVQKHMTDKGHCMMKFEGDALAEYADYYDYSKSYPDGETADPDEEIEVPELDGDDYFLKLPSGNTIGHRSLFVYYKQSLNPDRQLAFPKRKLNSVLSTYRALGWSETDKVAAVKKARDIRFMRRVRSKHHMQVGVKANKLQHHFRHQVLF